MDRASDRPAGEHPAVPQPVHSQAFAQCLRHARLSNAWDTGECRPPYLTIPSESALSRSPSVGTQSPLIRRECAAPIEPARLPLRKSHRLIALSSPPVYTRELPSSVQQRTRRSWSSSALAAYRGKRLSACLSR
eukprot:scaffold3068_cov401-Prasinococcus_capsulatus_cf.AAC.3